MKNQHGIKWTSFDAGDHVQIDVVPVIWAEIASKEVRNKVPSIYIRLADGGRARCGFDQIRNVRRSV